MTIKSAHSDEIRDDPRHDDESVKGPRARGQGETLHDMVTIKETIKTVIQNLNLFC